MDVRLRIIAALLAASATVAQAQVASSESALVWKFKEQAAAAETAAAAKHAAADELAQFIASLKARLGSASSPDLEALEGQLAKQVDEANAADQVASAKRKTAAYAERALQFAQSHGQSNQVGTGSTTTAQSSTAEVPGEACTLDTRDAILAFDPGACLKEKTGASQGSTSLPGRVVDKKGVTATFAISGDASKATLKFANAHNLRLTRHSGTSGFRQRRVTLGYNVGIQTTNVTGSNGRLYGLGEKTVSRSLTELDRLDEKASLNGGISINGFRSVTAEQLFASVSDFVAQARAACTASAPLDQCMGEHLTAWIEGRPEYRRQLNDLYWGTAQKVAKWGLGVQGEVARPAFEYFPFETIPVPDPFHPGKTTTVLDLSNLPEGFPDKPLRRTEIPFTLSAYAFWHFPVAGTLHNRGITPILSGTWKRSYEIEKARRGVAICPAPTGGPLQTNENCQTVNAAPPEGKDDYYLSGELRTLFDGWWVFHGFGLAPKFTYQVNGSRRSFDVPVYLAADKEGKLNGGLRFKWDFGGLDKAGVGRNDELLLSIFFNTNFDMNPQ